MAEVAAIVLAAGRATRFAGGVEGATKLVAELDGVPLVRHAVAAAVGSGATPVVLVTGHARDQVLRATAGLATLDAYNPDFASGIASSVRTGLAALPATSAAALVCLGDMPCVTDALARQLIAAFAQDPSLDAVAPIVEGRRGNPVLISRRLFADAMRLEGDEGARRLLMRKDLRVAEVAVDDAGAALDVDTPEALQSLGTSRSR